MHPGAAGDNKQGANNESKRINGCAAARAGMRADVVM
jgi:hypothetical protein